MSKHLYLVWNLLLFPYTSKDIYLYIYLLFTSQRYYHTSVLLYPACLFSKFNVIFYELQYL